MIAHPPPLASTLPKVSERLACSLAAAQRFQVPANVMLAVATVEDGRAGLWLPNTNGSYDLGAMQLNTNYIATLARYGIRADHVLAPGCYAYMLAAWRLHGHLSHDAGEPWRRVANYNSRTPLPNLRYQARLAPVADAWRRWLDTYDPRMASVGGAELASPSFPSSLTAASAVEVRRRRQLPLVPETRSIDRRCEIACAPMRVELAFKGPRPASTTINPSS